MSKHFMVDIETLGHAPDGVVLSVGSVEFDPWSDRIGERLEVNLDIKEQWKRKINASTVEWWMEQDREVWNRTRDNVEPVSKALLKLKNHWLKDPIVWAKGPDFDCSILRHLYTTNDLWCPYSFRDTRDVRTAIWLGNQRGVAFPERNEEMAHVGIEDAVYQAKVVQACLKGIK